MSTYQRDLPPAKPPKWIQRRQADAAQRQADREEAHRQSQEKRRSADLV